MLLEQTIDKLNAMKLFALAKSLQERLERQDHQNLSKAEFVGLLVDDEWLYRENRKLTGRLRVAKFKDRAASLEAVNYMTARGLRKDQLLALAQNRWITTHQSVLVTGPSGSGKSFVAQALGQHACRSGFSAQYLRLPAAAEPLRPGTRPRHLRASHEAPGEALRPHLRRFWSGQPE